MIYDNQRAVSKKYVYYSVYLLTVSHFMTGHVLTRALFGVS